MNRTRSVGVGCRISRSGFSGERVFRVASSDGTDYIGAAPVHYFTTLDDEPIGAGVPAARGDQVEGWITALLIENGDGEASVAFPGGEMTRVKLDQIRQQSPEALSHVPTGVLQIARHDC
ncbi:MAG TPA: hypothetical protein VFF52_09875 [Isosphaeraceae bacterium]|nr:hypothetical protein [Isosphaeraceae bacterium]